MLYEVITGTDLVGAFQLLLEIAATAMAHQPQVGDRIAQLLGQPQAGGLAALACQAEIEIHRPASVGGLLQGFQQQDQPLHAKRKADCRRGLPPQLFHQTIITASYNFV